MSVTPTPTTIASAPITRASRTWTAISGLLGVVVLAVYFSQPLPLPPATTTLGQLAQFAIRYHNQIFVGAWIQGIGTLLVVIFFVSLVAYSGAATRAAGLMTMLCAAALWTVGLVEVGASMAIPASVSNGHLAEASAAYDFTNIFIHLIPIGPAGATYLALGVMLLGSPLLPRAFAYLALAIGAAFEIVGFIGMFEPNSLQDTITIILIIQEAWVAAAAVTMLIRVWGQPANAEARHRPGQTPPPAATP